MSKINRLTTAMPTTPQVVTGKQFLLLEQFPLQHDKPSQSSFVSHLKSTHDVAHLSRLVPQHFGMLTGHLSYTSLDMRREFEIEVKHFRHSTVKNPRNIINIDKRTFILPSLLNWGDYIESNIASQISWVYKKGIL
jgi:hypothetical protein